MRAATTTRPARRRAAGFTLTELMVVVAIVAILSTLAYTLLNPSATPADMAEEAAGLMREASRRAVIGGPVRADVAQALGITARTRIHVLAGSPRVIIVERLAENPLPAATANWVTVQSMTVPPQDTLVGWRPSADLTGGGVGPSVVLATASEVVVYCYSTARCDAATLYWKTTATQPTDYARTVMMPLGGSPVIYESW